MASDFSLSDLAAVTGGESGMNSWIWIIIFVLLIGGGGFGFGNRATSDQPATTQMMSDQFNFEALRAGQADVAATVKDVAYTNLTGIRDVEAALAANSAKQDACCCETLRAIDGVNYNSALNTQKVIDAITGNRMADMQNQINSLQLQAQLAGVVRYPSAITYNGGVSPFCGTGCGCGC